ncbi:uncharacterized protein [Diadema setosum]|uniref:uncharacterized protein n=1 Tax=Diadema setosum TaxID=31175 RepID=UPI003B3BE598
MKKAKTLYYAQKRNRAIKMSEEKIQKRLSAPACIQDVKSTPPKNEVFHGSPPAVSQYMCHHSTPKKQPSNDGDVCVEGIHQDGRMPCLPSVSVDHSAPMTTLSKSWDGPMVSVQGGFKPSLGGNVNPSSTHMAPPAGMEGPCPLKPYGRSCEEPSDQNVAVGDQGESTDDMYLTFGSCSLEEPIYASEVCMLGQDKPMFIQPKWVCQEQKF